MLAGGAARRLGRPKATAELAGRSMIAHPLAALAAAGLEAIVVAKADTQLPPLEAAVVEEADEPRHPLAGVLAALAAAQGRPIVVVPCDTPFVPAALLAHFATMRARAAVVESDRIHPLLGRYEPSCAPALQEALAAGRSATAAALALDPLVVGPNELARYGDPARITFNVNTPADLERAAAMALP